MEILDENQVIKFAWSNCMQPCIYQFFIACFITTIEVCIHDGTLVSFDFSDNNYDTFAACIV